MRRSLEGLGLIRRLTLKGTASATARRRTLFPSSSACPITTWSPPSSTTTSARHTSAPADNTSTTDAAAAFQRLRSAISSGKPWLVLPPQALEQHQGQGRSPDAGHGGVASNSHFIGLLDIESSTTVSVPVPRDAEEELLKWRWIGSSQGWLILGDPKTNYLCLFNPVYSDYTKSSSNYLIRIPLPDVYPRKPPTRVFLTSPLPSSTSYSSQSHPVSTKCQVFALYESCIAFCSLDADSNSSSMPWKLLANWNKHNGPYDDFFLGGRWLFSIAYAEYIEYVEHWSLHGNSDPDVDYFDNCDFYGEDGHDMDGVEPHSCVKQKNYLLRWSPPAGQPLEYRDEDDHDKCDVLLVKRYVRFTEDGTTVGVGNHDFPQELLNKLRHKTIHFDVYRSRPRGNYGYKWEKVKSLGDQSLFLGYNQSSALPVAAVEGGPIKGNCIYFTDDYEGEEGNCLGGHDCGIFDMADQIIQPLHQYDFAELRPGARPFWLLTTSQP